MKKSSGGMSLLEVLISIGILFISFTFFLSLISTSYLGVKKGENIQFAANLGNTLLEDIHHKSFDQVALGTTTSSKSYTGALGNKPYTTNFNYTMTVSSVNSNLKDVFVTITWQERTPAGTRNKTLRLETLKFGTT